MNTLQIFPALILYARLQKEEPACSLPRGPPRRHTARSLVPYPSSADRFYLGLHNAANIMYRKRGQVAVPRTYVMQVEKCTLLASFNFQFIMYHLYLLISKKALCSQYHRADEAGKPPLTAHSRCSPIRDHCCPRRIVTRRKSIGARTNDGLPRCVGTLR